MSTDRKDDLFRSELDTDPSFSDDDFYFEGSFGDILKSLGTSELRSTDKTDIFDDDFLGFNLKKDPVEDEVIPLAQDSSVKALNEQENVSSNTFTEPSNALTDGLKDILSDDVKPTQSLSAKRSSDVRENKTEHQSVKASEKKTSKANVPQSPAIKSGKSKSHIHESDVMNEENWQPYEKKLKKNRVGFAIGITIYALLFIAAVIFGVRYLYNYLDAYEKTRPEHFMDALMPSMTPDDWYNLMREHCEIEATEFESIDDIYEAYYNAIVTSEDSSYRKKVGAYTDEKPVYSIRLGKTDMLLLDLVPDETKGAGYGYNYWKIGDVDILANGSGLNKASLEIDASSNARIYLNGILLTDDYIVDDKVPYELTALEERFDTRPYKVKYIVDGLYLNYTLTDDDGNELTAYKQDGNTYLYSIDRSERFEFSVKAMSDMMVFVNGTALSAEEALSNDDYPVLTGLEDYVNDIPSVLSWSFKDIRTKPEITCTDADGNELAPTVQEDGTLVFDYIPSAELEQKYSDRALGFINAYIKFATDDNNNTDTNYSKLVNYVLYKSDLHTYFYSSYLGGIHWASVLSYTVNDVGVGNFVQHGDNCFSCTAHFNITQKTYYETREYETTYVLVFVKSGNSWYAVKMDDSAA